MIDEKEARILVVESGRMLLDEGLSTRTWGNISCRTGERDMVITPSGRGYEKMTPDDIVPVNMVTGEWEGSLKPSSEKAVHIAAYQAFPDAGFVIHTHQTYASAIGLAGFDSLFRQSLDQVKATLGQVALADYALPGTKKLARNMTRAFSGGAHTVFMAHHGAVIIGKDRTESFERARLLEDTCRRACRGLPTDNPAYDEERARYLTELVKSTYGHAAYTGAAPVLACAAAGADIRAQLDDMAQMIGFRLSVTKPEDHAVIAALRKKDVVLIPGVGALCRANTDRDCHALCLLAEKACICRLNTQEWGVSGQLSGFDIKLMRLVYLKKYAKKIGG